MGCEVNERDEARRELFNECATEERCRSVYSHSSVVFESFTIAVSYVKRLIGSLVQTERSLKHLPPRFE